MFARYAASRRPVSDAFDVRRPGTRFRTLRKDGSDAVQRCRGRQSRVVRPAEITIRPAEDTCLRRPRRRNRAELRRRVDEHPEGTRAGDVQGDRRDPVEQRAENASRRKPLSRRRVREPGVRAPATTSSERGSGMRSSWSAAGQPGADSAAMAARFEELVSARSRWSGAVVDLARRDARKTPYDSGRKSESR